MGSFVFSLSLCWISAQGNSDGLGTNRRRVSISPGGSEGSKAGNLFRLGESGADSLTDYRCRCASRPGSHAGSKP